MTNHQPQQTGTNVEIQSRRFAYLRYGSGPASIAVGLLGAGILAMMLTLNWSKNIQVSDLKQYNGEVYSPRSQWIVISTGGALQRNPGRLSSMRRPVLFYAIHFAGKSLTKFTLRSTYASSCSSVPLSDVSSWSIVFVNALYCINLDNVFFEKDPCMFSFATFSIPAHKFFDNT